MLTDHLAIVVTTLSFTDKKNIP